MSYISAPAAASVAIEMASSRIAFGPFVLDEGEGRLSRHGEDVALLPKDMAVLCFMAARPGRVISKDELLDGVWGHQHVSESVLKTVISRLRSALGDDAKQPACIETAQRRGYRFIAVPQPLAQAPASAATALGNVPAALPPLHGRAGDLAMLDRLLQQHRWVTITGPGGIGKTRVALAAATAAQGRFPGGTWLIELAPLTKPELLIDSVAQVIGLQGEAARSGPSGLARAIHGLHALLIIDNAEHLADAAAALAEALMLHAPKVRLLVTSQLPLRSADEVVHQLHGLRVPQPAAEHERRSAQRTYDAASADGADSNAATLFVDRVRTRQPEWEPAPQELADVQEICRRLDGIPLALELAAARVPLLGLHGVRERLDDRLSLLTRGARAAPARQQTLAQALQWTFELLPQAQQTVWRRLGVFAGSFTLETAHRVAGDETLDSWTVLEALGTLVELSLVKKFQTVSPHKVVRYRLLENPRSFALSQLEAAGESVDVRRRHAQATLHELQQIRERALDLPVFEWHAQALLELDNLRAALTFAHGEHGDAPLRVALVGWGRTAWTAAGTLREAVQALDAVESEIDRPEVDDAARGQYWQALAYLGTMLAVTPQRGMHAAHKASEIANARGDVVGHFWSLSFMLLMAQWTGCTNTDRARMLAQMKALADPAWPALRRRPLGFALALEAMQQGRWPECRDLFQAQYESLLLQQDHRNAWIAGANLAHALLMLDETPAAAELAREVVAQARALGRPRAAWAALGMLGVASIVMGDRETADTAMGELFEYLGADDSLWWAADYWAALLLLRGHAQQAAAALGHADAQVRHLSVRRQPFALKLRERTEARLRAELDDASLASARESGMRWQQADLRAALGL